MNELDKGSAIGAGVIGILLLCCGLGSSITGFVWLSYTYIGSGGFGLWGGLPLLIAGILGIIAWLKRNKGVLIGFMILCIIMIIVAAIQAGLSGLVYAVWHTYVGGSCWVDVSRCYCRTSSGETKSYDDKRACDAIQAVQDVFLSLTIFSALGSILCLAGSILGCVGLCSNSGQPGATVVQQPPIVIHTAGQPPAYGQQAGYPGYPGYPMTQPVAYSQDVGSQGKL